MLTLFDLWPLKRAIGIGSKNKIAARIWGENDLIDIVGSLRKTQSKIFVVLYRISLPNNEISSFVNPFVLLIKLSSPGKTLNEIGFAPVLFQEPFFGLR